MSAARPLDKNAFPYRKNLIVNTRQAAKKAPVLAATRKPAQSKPDSASLEAAAEAERLAKDKLDQEIRQREDRVAEQMRMLAEFKKAQDDRREAGALRNHRLYTSLEPCPMCIARLIIAGCPCVIYVADDPQGGMAKHLEGFPPIWRNLAEPCRFIKADCSPQLQELANRLFLYSAADLDARLAARSAGC